MRRLLFFAEDAGHEQVIGALVRRLAAEHAIEVSLAVRSASGGHGRVLTELRHFLRDLKRQMTTFPDLVLVGLDANCKGYVECRREVDAELAPYPFSVVCAIPDPHIERWLLLDAAAFRAALGRGCSAPDLKCERDRYKKQLSDAVREAGVTPLLGGIEHAEEIVNAMDLARVEQADDSLGKFLSALRGQFQQWKLGTE